jgi:hypothetical protein
MADSSELIMKRITNKMLVVSSTSGNKRIIDTAIQNEFRRI